MCEAVLVRLDINNLLTWKRGLVLVKDIVGGVDYKVVYVLLSICVAGSLLVHGMFLVWGTSIPFQVFYIVIVSLSSPSC